MQTPYTTQLQAGLGMIEETRSLLEMWRDDMDVPSLAKAALQSGRFPNMSARRLRNVVAECFAPRFLAAEPKPASVLKQLSGILSQRELNQTLFLFTCRANPILADFVRSVYWEAYSAGRTSIGNEDAQAFVVRANEEGKTAKSWSPTTIRRVSSYLTGACADFGLLESGRSIRNILPYRIELRVVAILAYDLHFTGASDDGVVASQDWQLFGLDPADTLAELRRLALAGFLIVQSAGDLTRIGWRYKSWNELIDVFAQG